VTAKADQPGFVRVQRQFELAHSLLEIVKEGSCLVLMLEADDGVVHAKASAIAMLAARAVGERRCCSGRCRMTR
jgi:hypothetical protein